MTDKWGSLCEFPSEMLEDVCFMDEYMELLNSELDKRVNAILKSNFEILNEQKYYNNEEIELGVQLKIKRLAIGQSKNRPNSFYKISKKETTIQIPYNL